MKYYLLTSDNKSKEITDGQVWFTVNAHVMDYINEDEALENAVNDIITITDNNKLIIEKVNQKSIILKEYIKNKVNQNIINDLLNLNNTDDYMLEEEIYQTLLDHDIDYEILGEVVRYEDFMTYEVLDYSGESLFKINVDITENGFQVSSIN